VDDDVAAMDAQRRELQRRVFSATSDSADARVAARQLQQLESRLLQQVLDKAPRTSVESVLEAQPPASDIETRSGTGLGVHDTAAVSHVAPSRSNPFVYARSAAAVILALVIGVALGLAGGSARVASPEAAPSRPSFDTSGALALFDRPQLVSDLPDRALPGTVIGESIRAIGDPFFGLYIGRNAANMVCLFAVQPADSFAMSCVTIDEFPSTGIRLEWSGEMASMSADGTSSLIPSTMRAIWRPDGSLDLGGGPR
jgi:hypothetical protein